MELTSFLLLSPLLGVKRDLSALAKKSSRNAGFFINDLKTFDGEKRACEVRLKIHSLSLEQPLNDSDIAFATNAVRGKIAHFAAQVNSQNLPHHKGHMLENSFIEKELSNLNLAGRIENITLYIEA